MYMKIYSEILSFFPEKIKKQFDNVSNDTWTSIKEIRIRVDRPIMIQCFNKEYFLDYIVNVEDILRLIENFSENSIYSFQNEINAGFITIRGGHRIGISGTSVFENNQIKNIKYISSLNIRVAREVKFCSEELIKKICINDFENTIIISPPGCGKTTILRDAIRILSNGTENIRGKNIGLVDERSEIAAVYKGVPQNDVGIRTDVMNNCKKEIGMQLLIRSMGPQIIATDEIGSLSDIEAIMDACNSGIKLLLTSHGNDLEDIPNELINKRVFNNVVILDNKNKPGEIKKIYRLESKEYVAVS